MTVAVAGNKVGDKIKVTNVPKWPIVDAEELKEKFNLKQFNLLNDFEANGYGACEFGLHENGKLITINEGEQQSNDPKIITGPGTGLGCALIIYNQALGEHTVLRGEGGHTEFTATTEQEIRLREFTLTYLRDRGHTIERVSVERLTAGPAIPMIYEFFQQEYPDMEVILQPLEETGEVDGSEVVKNALTDPLCKKTIDQFISNLAVFVSDVILVAMAGGGVYLTGGVTEGLITFFQSEECKFLDIMQNKGRLSDYIKKVPIYIFKNAPGLDGAEQYGLQNLAHNKVHFHE